MNRKLDLLQKLMPLWITFIGISNFLVTKKKRTLSMLLDGYSGIIEN